MKTQTSPLFEIMGAVIKEMETPANQLDSLKKSCLQIRLILDFTDGYLVF